MKGSTRLQGRFKGQQHHYQTRKKKIKTKFECPCFRFFLSKLQKSHKCKITTTLLKRQKPETENGDASVTRKSKRKSKIIRIPKIGSSIPYFIALFTYLKNTGALQMDEVEMMKAVNATVKAKRDLDEGLKWNGDISLSDNIKLKLHKSGLVLHYKK